MISKVNDELMVQCESCGADQFGGLANFKEFMAEIKEDGWKPYKEHGEWHHLCPDCAE